MKLPDPERDPAFEIVRDYRNAALAYPTDAQKIAYQEGVMAAAWALSAYIDVLPDGVHSGWKRQLDTIFDRLLGVKLQVPFPTPPAKGTPHV